MCAFENSWTNRGEQRDTCGIRASPGCTAARQKHTWMLVTSEASLQRLKLQSPGAGNAYAPVKQGKARGGPETSGVS